MNQTTFSLEPIPPFRLDLTIWALRRRPHNQVDRWDGRTHRRVLALNGELVEVALTQVAPPETPRLQVTATSAREVPGMEAAVAGTLRRMLGLDIDLSSFYQFAASDPHLGPLASRFHGFKPPRYATLFEALLNGIACQQVTLNLGVQLLNRLAATCGAAMSDLHALPQPEALIHQEAEVLRGLGFSRQKARAMIELAGAMLEGRLTLEELTALDSAAAVSRLCQFRGIGRWTAEYVLLRGLGRLDVFPSGDSGARNSLQRWLGLGETLDDADIQRRLDQWRSYGGLIYLHLLLRGLAESEAF